MPAFFFSMSPMAMLRTALVAVATATVSLAAPVAPGLLLLDGVAAGPNLVVVGERGSILHSPDRGHSWQSASCPVATTLTGVTFSGGSSHGWVVGHDAVILATSDAGLTWQKQWQGANLQDSFLDVLAIDAQHVIAVGAYGLFAATDDGGKTWVRRKIIDEDYHLNRITRGPGGTLYLAGEHGTLLRSGNAGATWEHIDAPYDGSFYGILPLDARTLVAYGLRGRIFRSEDDGATWTPVANDQRVLLATALRLADGHIVFAGQSRGWFISRDGGRTVTPWTAPSIAAVAELLELPDGSLLALGEAGVVALPKP